MKYQYFTTETDNAKSAKNSRTYCSAEASSDDYIKKKEMRYQIRKRNERKARFFIVFCLVFGLLMPVIFFNNLNTLFINRLKNRQVKLTENLVRLNPLDSLYLDNVFMKTAQSDYIDNKNPQMSEPELSKPMSNLTGRIKNLMAGYPNLEPGVFIWDYTTGKYVDINAHKAFPTASMIKLPVLLNVYKRNEIGLVDLDAKIPTSDPVIAEGSGSLQYSPVGSKLPVKRLAELMIQDSDNTATNMLLEKIGGMSELNRATKTWGMNVTHFSNWLPDLDGTNISTPYEMSAMLYNIDNADFLSIKSRAEITEIMGHVKNRFLIQHPLPANVQFLHKSGDIGGMLGDAGIVILPDGRKYLIAVMVKRPWNDYTAKQLIIDISDATYKAISSGAY